MLLAVVAVFVRCILCHSDIMQATPTIYRFDGENLVLQNAVPTHNTHFDVEAIVYDFVPALTRDEGGYEDFFDALAYFFAEIADFIEHNFHREDFVQVGIHSDNLNHPVSSNLLRVADYRTEALLAIAVSVLNSNEEIGFGDASFRIQIDHIRMPRGGGGGRNPRIRNNINITLDDLAKKTYAIISIPESLHPRCGVISLIIGQERAEGKVIRQSRVFRTVSERRRYREESKELCEKAKVPFTEMLSAEQLKKVCRLPRFSNYKIICINRDQGNNFMFKTNLKAQGGEIHLVYSKGEYGLVTKMNAYFGRDKGFLCCDCERFVTSKKKHVCHANICQQCKTHCCSLKRSTGNAIIECPHCFRFFNNQKCYDNHLLVNASPMFPNKVVCENIIKCITCDRDLQAKDNCPTGRNAYDDRNHVCFEITCRHCGHKFDHRFHHECYLMPVEIVKDPEKLEKIRGRFVFYDIECMKVPRQGGGGFVFQPNLLIMQFESGDEIVFKGADCVKDFVRFVFLDEGGLAHMGGKWHVIAHNASRFDALFLMQCYFDLCVKVPHVTWDGCSLKKIRVGNIVLLDSCCFIQTKLENFPKMFGLRKDIFSKGFFPYAFSLLENQGYKGRIPKEAFFEPHLMSAAKKKEFDDWYTAELKAYVESGKVWDFDEENVSYCRQDVNILREGFLTYIRNMFEITDLYPMYQASSIAGFSNNVFRSMIKKWCMAIVPTGGYGKRDQQSAIALEYLQWLNQFYYGGMMQTSMSEEGEKRINIGSKIVKVDGYVEDVDCNGEPVMRVFEFFGCVFHGCPNCFSEEQKSPAGIPMIDEYNKSMERIDKLEWAGCTVEVMWECEWKKEKNSNPEIAMQLEEIAHVFQDYRPPFDCREALRGGRTESFGFYAAADEKTSLKFLDYVSLYPSVMAGNYFPRGHPRIFSKDFDYECHAYFGLIHCTVLPPTNRYIPSLPTTVDTKSGPKLMFTLCRTCAAEQNFVLDSCCHSEDERCLEGVFCTPELYHAIEKHGYVLKKIFQVWHYHNRDKGIYAPFVKKFQKIKQEASGWPKGVITEKQKDDFIAEYKEKEGVDLERNKIKSNPPARTNAKTILNSSWGKFVQRVDRVNTQIITQRSALDKWLQDEGRHEKQFLLLSPQAMLLKDKHKETFLKGTNKGNFVHGCFVTMGGRMKLMEAMDAITNPKQVKYVDTDSIFFTQKKNEVFDLPLGSQFGKLSDVVEDENVTICEFVSGGAKNYGYKMVDAAGKKTEKFKARGFTLNHATSLKVGFEKLKSIIFKSRNYNLGVSQLSMHEANQQITESGFVNDETSLSKTFSIKRGAKRKMNTFESGGTKTFFELEPIVMQKMYKVVFDKRVPDWNRLISYPFGYRFAANEK